jgi:hypothetical protein
MNRITSLAWVLVVLLDAAIPVTTATAQAVLFDFDNAPVHTPLPLDLTVGGITAHFSATGQGFSIQAADTLGFTPARFSGNCLYPSSVFAADLLVSFSKGLTNFSILYSPQELGCDDSARMKVTAYLDGTPVGTNTTTASSPGTWPSETLSLGTTQPFNQVVVHYDARPPTCQDYGVIFMADNMNVTPAPEPPSLQISQVADQIQLVWPAGATAFALRAKPDSLVAGDWETVTNVPVLIGDSNFLTLPVETHSSFYRLESP